MNKISPPGNPPDRSSARTAAPLASVSVPQWRGLARRAIEPNGYHLPDWLLQVSDSARGRTDIKALAAWSMPPSPDGAVPRMIGLLPVVSAWRAFKLPLPALVSADAYATLSTPLIDRTLATEAVSNLMQRARDAGARALILRDITLDGEVMQHVTRVLAASGTAPRILQSHARAFLDASRNADELLRDALGAKKLKELRRQRNRLADLGDVAFTVARNADEVAAALEVFLDLEASGWKAARGTALKQHDGDAAFIRHAVAHLAEQGFCEVITLHAGATALAAAVVLRHQGRAFYFKMGVNEDYAKYSPGVQLTLELTRHLCNDPEIATADSMAMPGHAMIDPIWRGRLSIGDVLIPLRARDPLVSLIHTALNLRSRIRQPLRKFVHYIRSRQE